MNQQYIYGQPNTIMLPQQQILQVNGKPTGMNMAPNSSVIALDAAAMIAWVCVSDGVGSVTMTPFDMTPHQEPQPVDVNTFDKRLTAMDNTGIVPTMNVGGADGAGGFMWIFGLIVLLALFNGNGIGGGNGNANAIQADVNRGFDNQNLQAQTRDLMGAVTAQGQAAIAATNQSFHDTLMANQSLYNETARDIAALNVAIQQVLANQNNCCCETKQLIMQSDYNGAMRDSQTRAEFTSQIQGVKDLIAQNKIEALQNQVNQLQLQNQLANVVRYPTSTVYGVPSPCFAYGGGCGCAAV